MRSFFEWWLGFFARKIVAKYKPVIIGITGSVGKTSTRNAVFAVVSQKYSAYTPPKNLNDKIGLPLGILGMDSPGRSAWGWCRVAFRAFLLWVLPRRYPDVLVLEYGIDRVGEMDALLAVARPAVGLLTSIGLSHYEFFQDAETIEREKGKLVEAVPTGESNAVVLNADNEAALRQAAKSKARVLTYGRAGDVRLQHAEERLSASATTTLSILTPTRTVDAVIAAVGTTHVASVLAAVAVSETLGVETDLIQKGLAAYRPTPSRLSVIAGLKRSVLIDDTYNAAPDSMHEALQLFARFPGTHKIAVLGDMLELGALSDEAHKAVGVEVARLAPSHLITVGAGGRIIADSAVAAGLPEERVISFDSSLEAQIPVQNLIREGSAVLVKGSQGVRMEKVVKEVMAEPMRAGELVCRQYGKWLLD